MDETLPGTVSLTLNQALDQWQHWRKPPHARPHLEAVLDAGRSNTSLKVGDGQRSWVVRIDGFPSERMGLSRDAEWRALQNAAAADLAPQPAYRNPALRVLVCEYCEARPGAISSLAEVAALLRNIHQLPAIKFRLDPLHRARAYLSVLGERELPDALLAACERLDPVPLTLCHNDLLRANRLMGKHHMLALDWEYAAMGDPLFDLAAVIEGDDMSDDEAKALHTAWLGDLPTAAEQTRLADQRRVYRELAALWARAMPVLQHT